MTHRWSQKWGKMHVCGITHARLRPGVDKYGNPYTATLPCGHRFYTKPLLKWATQSDGVSTCPLCRDSFAVVVDQS